MSDRGMTRRDLLTAVAASVVTSGAVSWIVTRDGGPADGHVHRVNDVAAAQSALQRAEPGDTIQFGPGEFRGSLVVDTSGLTLAGVGQRGTVLSSTSADVLTVSVDSAVTNLTLRDLTIRSQSGGGHGVVVGSGLNQSVIERVRFIQANDDRHLLVGRRSKQGGFFDNHIRDSFFLMPETSSASGISLGGEGNVASSNLWSRCRFQGGGTYLVEISAGADSFCYNNTFEAITFEQANAGAIRIRGGANTLLQGIGMFDNSTIVAAPIVFGRSVGGVKSRSNTIINYLRSNGSLAPDVSDIEFRPGENAGRSVVINAGGSQRSKVKVDPGGNIVEMVP